MIIKNFRIYFILLLTFISCKSSAQMTSNNSLNHLCKVWGFMKYFHPQINDGSVNWDSVLIANINDFDQELTQEDFNAKIKRLIQSAGPIKTIHSERKNTEGNSAIEWLFTQNALNPSNKELLIDLAKRYDRKNNYYALQPDSTARVSFSNEVSYKEMVFPDKEYRLLSLFRAWNAVNYFFPYKKHMDTDMNSVLNHLIPEIKNANDTLAYHGALKKFSSSLNDSHANLSLSQYLLSLYPYRTAASTRYVEGKFVFNETDSAHSINTGDILLQVNNKDVHLLADSLQQYWNASNEVTTMGAFDFFMLSGSTKSVNITIRRDKQPFDVVLKRSKALRKKSKPSPHMSLLKNGEIAYLKTSPPGDIAYLDSLLTISKKKKGIIIDLRGNSPFLHYPTFAKHFFPEPREWAILNIPDNNMPGTFKRHDEKPWKKWGIKKNTDYYKGPIIVLVDDFTQSYLEYFAMFLKQGKTTTIIGSQTAGADGNTSRIYLPGGFKLVFTSVEVLWPNGEQTQRVGLKPDLNVAPTIKSIQENKDLVLEAAVKYILQTAN